MGFGHRVELDAVGDVGSLCVVAFSLKQARDALCNRAGRQQIHFQRVQLTVCVEHWGLPWRD
jgi:hypothetical protein